MDLDSPILIVEDDEPSAEEIVEGLETWGIRCFAERDINGALDVLRSEPRVSVVVSDIHLASGTGIDLLSAVSGQEETYREVILITGSAGTTEAIAALRLGAYDFLYKPCDLEQLSRVVRAAQQRAAGRMAASLSNISLHESNERLSARFQEVQRVLGRYVDHEVVQSLMRSPDSLRIGGERAEVTVLVADLRGFTELSESLPPEQVVVILNNYLEEMIEIVHRFGGIVDNIIGDAVMAVFGAPTPSADDAGRAIRCALEMQQGMARVNRKNRRVGVGPTEIGIGINTGDVVVGNIGSEQHAKYSVIGSPVNRAWRIESFTLGGQILASKATIDAARVSVRTNGGLRVKLRGVASPVEIHEVSGVDAALSAAVRPRTRGCGESCEAPLLAAPRSLRASRLVGTGEPVGV